MYVYEQSTGKLFREGRLIGIGYAGREIDKNIPESQCKHGLGPLPRGFYTIGKSYTHPHLGPLCFNLEPDAANDMCDPPRALFRIHADAIGNPGSASDGCVVMGKAIRMQIEVAGDTRLQVVARLPEVVKV